MYYRLNEDLRLRGWKLLPTGIARKLSGKVEFVPPKVFRALQKALVPLPRDSPLFSPEECGALERLLAEGILEESGHPAPLTEQQAYRTYPNRFLRSVHWAVTGKCNARCRHCCLSAPKRTDMQDEAGEFSHEECLGIVRQMEAAGVRTVSLTGGEALARPDFFEIVDALLAADILVTAILSNGLLVNEGTLGELERRGIRPEIHMSFDGVGCHDWLRGVEGAEAAVARAFSLCRERGFPTGAAYCLHRGNIHALAESVRLLASLGVSSLKVTRLRIEGEAEGIPDEAISCDEEFRAYLDYIPRFFEDGAPINLLLAGFFSYCGGSCGIPFVKHEEGSDCGNLCLCGHARNRMYITPEGFMVPCISMGSTAGGRRRFPNIRETTLADALCGSFYMDFIDTRLAEYFAHNPGCAACEYRNRCAGGCRGNVDMGGDDLLARDEDTCRFFQGGWYDRLADLLKKIGARI